jgi:hypothetical protein
LVVVRTFSISIYIVDHNEIGIEVVQGEFVFEDNLEDLQKPLYTSPPDDLIEIDRNPKKTRWNFSS